MTFVQHMRWAVGIRCWNTLSKALHAVRGSLVQHINCDGFLRCWPSHGACSTSYAVASAARTCVCWLSSSWLSGDICAQLWQMPRVQIRIGLAEGEEATVGYMSQLCRIRVVVALNPHCMPLRCSVRTSSRSCWVQADKLCGGVWEVCPPFNTVPSDPTTRLAKVRSLLTYRLLVGEKFTLPLCDSCLCVCVSLTCSERGLKGRLAFSMWVRDSHFLMPLFCVLKRVLMCVLQCVLRELQSRASWCRFSPALWHSKHTTYAHTH